MRTCAKCHQSKPLSEFSYKDKEKQKLNYYCKDCNREYQRKHYANHQQDYRSKRKKWRSAYKRQIRKKITDYLENHPCVDCGEKDIAVLEFDHIKGQKEDNISSLLCCDVSWERLKLEIGKCEVRCANCHKRKSAKQFGWYKY